MAGLNLLVGGQSRGPQLLYYFLSIIIITHGRRDERGRNPPSAQRACDYCCVVPQAVNRLYNWGTCVLGRESFDDDEQAIGQKAKANNTTNRRQD